MPLYNIFIFSLKHSIRQPFYFVVLICSLIMIGLFPLLAFFSFGEQVRMVFDSSMALILTFSILLLVLLSDKLIYNEIASGTIMVLFSKPIGKRVFILGKFLGIFSSLLLYSSSCCIAALVSCYAAAGQFDLNFPVFYLYYALILAVCCVGMAKSFFSKSSFSAVAGIGTLLFLLFEFGYLFIRNPHFFSDNGLNFLALIEVVFLVITSLSIMSAISILISTRFNLFGNLIICFSIFILGLVSDYLFGEYVRNGSILFSVIYTLIPNWQFFWLMDVATSGSIISPTYLILCFLYSVSYVAFCCCLASFLLKNVELAKKNIK